ncbi:MAG: hypothetical protein LH467_04160, partial [Gemmatimonadaceae bacterium]|nr:hypothetical protein [Gemmatimonadaceae bacterium]
MTPPAYIIVGRVRKAHGIRGEVVVEVITDAPDPILACRPGVLYRPARCDQTPK